MRGNEGKYIAEAATPFHDYRILIFENDHDRRIYHSMFIRNASRE